jgi:hypothetical protein
MRYSKIFLLKTTMDVVLIKKGLKTRVSYSDAHGIRSG